MKRAGTLRAKVDLIIEFHNGRHVIARSDDIEQSVVGTYHRLAVDNRSENFPSGTNAWIDDWALFLLPSSNVWLPQWKCKLVGWLVSYGAGLTFV